jgi:hypothetical protein
MKTLLLASLLLLTGTSSTPTGDKTVYMCMGTSEVYHSTDKCKKLTRCTHEIREVSESVAVSEYKRRACKVCAN